MPVTIILFCLFVLRQKDQKSENKLNSIIFLLIEKFWFSITDKERWNLKDEGKCSDGNQLSAKNVTLLKDTHFSEKKMKVQISCEGITAQTDIQQW